MNTQVQRKDSRGREGVGGAVVQRGREGWRVQWCSGGGPLACAVGPATISLEPFHSCPWSGHGAGWKLRGVSGPSAAESTPCTHALDPAHCACSSWVTSTVSWLLFQPAAHLPPALWRPAGSLRVTLRPLHSAHTTRSRPRAGRAPVARLWPCQPAHPQAESPGPPAPCAPSSGLPAPVNTVPRLLARFPLLSCFLSTVPCYFLFHELHVPPCPPETHHGVLILLVTILLLHCKPMWSGSRWDWETREMRPRIPRECADVNLASHGDMARDTDRRRASCLVELGNGKYQRDTLTFVMLWGTYHLACL